MLKSNLLCFKIYTVSNFKILIIDDDATVCSSLMLLLKKRGSYEATFIQHPSLAEDTIDTFKPDLILLDMNFTIDTSGRQGIKLLSFIRDKYPSISIILMTGWATVQLAVEGMKLGAKDFVAKPWDNGDLLDSIASIFSLHHTLPSNSKKSNDTVADYTIIGESPIMLDILDMVSKVAPTEASVLITGESGTGKELVAEAIHHQSKRSDQAFVKVNLGGISTSLFESEMFGHLKGSFTGAYTDREGRFAAAHGGSIFLDELGELSMDSQVKLLRVLQEKTYEQLGSNKPQRTNVRVISATNRDLQQMSIHGSFREDLYYRVNLINIHLPPLRERREDIPLLVHHFIHSICDVHDSQTPLLTDDTLNWLSMQEYRGNIRQLKNIIERTYLLNMSKKELAIADFLASFDLPTSTHSMRSNLNLEELEIATIKKALAKYNYSISNASKALGITRSSLYRRLVKYNISYEF